MKIQNFIQKNYAYKLIYAIIFLYLVFQPAIYTPDSSSYVNASIIRSPGYAFFARTLKLMLSNGFDIIIVALQLIITLFSIDFLLKKLSRLLQLNTILNLCILIVLCLPLFAPLYIANNICSEGLSYPLYLLFLAFSLDFLILKTLRSFVFLIVVTFFLALTRSQFIIVPLIVAGIFIIKHKNAIFNIKIIKYPLILISLPLVITIADRTYHYVKDGAFVATPFSYINLNGATLYLSEQDDVNLIEDEDARAIFNDSYIFLSKNNWLKTQQATDDWSELYKHYHNNVGNICNYTLHDRARAYYYKKGLEIVDVHIAAENSAKVIYKTLLKNDFKDWLLLAYHNLINAFKHFIILVLFIIVFGFSLIQLFKKNSKNATLVFFFSSLILSNALVVAVGSHSILRYIFYNYLLMFIIAVIWIKKIIPIEKPN